MAGDRTLILDDENTPFPEPGETIKSVVLPETRPDDSLDGPVPEQMENVSAGDMPTKVPSSPPAPPGSGPRFGLSPEGPPLKDCSKEFAFEHLIGQGGQGQVWAAVDLTLGRPVAVKRMTKRLEFAADFLKEVYTSAQLDHPNIVPVYGVGLMASDEGPAPMMAMKRVSGTPWKDHLAADRIMPNFRLEDYLRKHLAILVQVLHAIDYAHSKNIIHRDLKPGQVMIGDFGEVYLLDWGLAICMEQAGRIRRTVGGPGRGFTLQTASNPAGTPAYMAPEQALFRTERLGLHTDIYLLGAILYELLMGHPPHHAEQGKLRLADVRNNVFRPVDAAAPRELAELATACLETEPTLRPASPRAMLRVIEAYLTGASRKHDSTAITTELAALDPQVLDHYQALSHYSRRLSQAISLWPDNPEAPFCRNLILSAYVTVALGKRDFLLAQLQAERVEDEDWSRGLLEQVESARDAASRSIPQPPLFTRGRVAALLGCWLLVGGALGLITHRARTVMEGEVHSKVRTLATLAAQDVQSADLLAVDRDRQIYSDTFQRTLQRLNVYRRSNEDIRYIYTLRPEFTVGADTWRVLVDADPLDLDMDGDGLIGDDEKGNPPGALYEDGVPAMTQAFEQGVATSSELKDEWGHFISGFAPVLDSSTSSPVALVGVDIPLAEVEDKFRLVALTMTLVGGVLLVLVTATCLAFFSARRALTRVRMLETEVAAQCQQVRGKGLHL